MGLRFVPYPELGGTPNIVVDGRGNPATRLVLSHWPGSGTPAALKADTSAEIVFRHLDRPEFRVDADAVSNNHFDEDGLVGVWTMLRPGAAQARRARLIDVAEAGDFGACRERESARIAFTISAFADPGRSPLDGALFARPHDEMAAGLYGELLPRLEEIVRDVGRFRAHWEAEDAHLAESEAAVRSGGVRIEEFPALDLAVVTIPAAPDRAVHRFTQSRRAACHPMAIHNATRRFRILVVQGRRYELQYRYESWVQYVSARPAPRADLAPLAARLSEEAGEEWRFDGVEEITPSLRLEGAGESRLAPERFVAEVKSFLSSAPPAWDPYDPFR
jgi:hypothetical protein